MERPTRRSALIASRSTVRRWSMVSALAWPAHWNGVCGLGTKPPIETVQGMALGQLGPPPARVTPRARSAVSSTVLLVLAAKADMKQRLTRSQPLADAVGAVGERTALG